MNALAPVPAYFLKEGIIQILCEPVHSELGVNPHKMDISLLRVGLGDEATEKGDYFVVSFHYKTSTLKMDEKQPGELIGHVTTTPPFIDNGYDLIVVAFGYASNADSLR